MNYRLLIYITLILLCITSPLNAQTNLHLTKAEALADLLPGYSPFLGAGISPDGSMIAWWGGDRGLCLYTIDSASVRCTPWPDGFRNSPYFVEGSSAAMSWSLDSRQVVFTENLVKYSNESDIWVYDVAADKFTDLTDDAVTGNSPVRQPSDTPPPLDYLPVWNPATGDLYFFRSLHTTTSTSLALYRIPAQGGEPAQVVDLTGKLPGQFPVYIPPSFSSDGSQMVLMVQSQQQDDPANGVWDLNLTDDSLTQAVRLADLSAFLPASTNGQTFLQSVSWANGGMVITVADPTQPSVAASNTFFWESESNTLKAMVDFTALTNQGAYYRPGSDGHSPLYALPRAGVVSPDGKSYIYLHFELPGGSATISDVPLPLDGSTPVDLGEFPLLGPAPPIFATRSDDGMRLVTWGWLLTFEESAS
jgi:hypothetical protein